MKNSRNPPPPFGHPLPFSRFIKIIILEKGRGKNTRPPFFTLKKGGQGGLVACIFALLGSVFK